MSSKLNWTPTATIRMPHDRRTGWTWGHNPMHDWCEDNLLNRFSITLHFEGRSDPMGAIIGSVFLCEFENEDDAAVFALKWS
jgi:hypothetical protein